MLKSEKKSWTWFFPWKICYDLGHSYHLVGPEKEHRLSLAISHEVPRKIFHEILHYILHPQIVISSLLYVDHPQLKLCTQILRTGDCHWRLVATSLLRSLAGSLSSAQIKAQGRTNPKGSTMFYKYKHANMQHVQNSTGSSCQSMVVSVWGVGNLHCNILQHLHPSVVAHNLTISWFRVIPPKRLNRNKRNYYYLGRISLTFLGGALLSWFKVLKNMKVNEKDYPIYEMENKKMFETTNQYICIPQRSKLHRNMLFVPQYIHSSCESSIEPNSETDTK